MLDTMGGDSETTLRLIRQTQSRCNKLTVIVPNQAKSAGTLFTLGADCIYMGPTSDLGPIDPQFYDPAKNDLYPAKAIIAAVEDADKRIQEFPHTYPLYASLLSDITSLMVQRAKNELERTEDQLKEALSCASDRDSDKIQEMAGQLQGPLIDHPQSHRMAVSSQFATTLGLPVKELKYNEQPWKDIWRLWAKYVVLNATFVCEGQFASQIFYRK